MQNVPPEMWQAGLIGFVIGFILAYLLLRLTKGSVKKQVQTESELQKVKSALNEQKQRIEKHFSESADLLKMLAQDYQKLYQHLANSANTLLPEQADKPLFNQHLLTENKSENATTNDDDQPKDYSEGSSGILKAER